MKPGTETGAELLKSLGIDAFSPVYKLSLIVIIVLCIFFYKKYKITEEIDDSLSSYHLTWISLGMTIVSLFCFIGSDTDPYAEVFLIYIAIFMCLYYLFSQYNISNKDGMSLKYWIQSFLVGVIDILMIIKISKDIALLIILVQTLCLILYESKKAQLKQRNMKNENI